jgi:hypothetical protein
MAEFINAREPGAYRRRRMTLDDFTDRQLFRRFRFTQEGIEVVDFDFSLGLPNPS